MKKFRILLAAALCLCAVFSFGGCYYFNSFPEVVTADNVRYKSGFYGNLYPIYNNIDHSHAYKVKARHKLYRLRSDDFDIICGTPRFAADFVCFVKEEQWEDAKNYYTSPDNLTFYMQVGNKYECPSTEIGGMDFDKLNELIVFVKAKEYDPYNPNKKVDLKAVPDSGDYTELRFYADSKDGVFTVMRHDLYIINGRLTLLYYFDGSTDELKYVDMPDGLNDYFLDLYNDYKEVSDGD